MGMPSFTARCGDLALRDLDGDAISGWLVVCSCTKPICRAILAASFASANSGFRRERFATTLVVWWDCVRWYFCSGVYAGRGLVAASVGQVDSFAKLLRRLSACVAISEVISNGCAHSWSISRSDGLIWLYD